MNAITAQFKHAAETKGAHKYQEVNDKGAVLDYKDGVFGTIYVRKSAFPNGAPQTLTLTAEFSKDA